MFDENVVHQEIYRDNPDKAYVKDLIILINNKRKRWVHDEARVFISRNATYGMDNATLEIYLRLFWDVTSIDSKSGSLVEFEELEFTSLSKLYEHLHKNHFTKEKKKNKPFKYVKSTDRKLFFGKNGIFTALLKAGLLVEVSEPNSKKYSYRTSIKLQRPKFSWALRYKLRNETEFYTGLEEYWGLDELSNALYIYLDPENEYSWNYFKEPYTRLPDDPDIDLISYLEGLLKRVDEVSLDFMARIALKYFKNKHPGLIK